MRRPRCAPCPPAACEEAGSALSSSSEMAWGRSSVSEIQQVFGSARSCSRRDSVWKTPSVVSKIIGSGQNVVGYRLVRRLAADKIPVAGEHALVGLGPDVAVPADLHLEPDGQRVHHRPRRRHAARRRPRRNPRRTYRRHAAWSARPRPAGRWGTRCSSTGMPRPSSFTRSAPWASSVTWMSVAWHGQGLVKPVVHNLIDPGDGVPAHPVEADGRARDACETT